jgi:hypothetical protein
MPHRCTSARTLSPEKRPYTIFHQVHSEAGPVGDGYAAVLDFQFRGMLNNLKMLRKPPG